MRTQNALKLTKMIQKWLPYKTKKIQFQQDAILFFPNTLQIAERVLQKSLKCF